MNLAAIASARSSVHGQLKLASLFEMPEREFETRVRAIEEQELFRRLVDLGVVSRKPYENACFAARRAAGRELCAGGHGLPGVLDGNGELVALISRIGQERFEEFFLGEIPLSDEARAESCGLSLSETRRLREFVDRLYVQAEFENPSTEAAPAKTFSAVAGIELEGGKPILAFFNREIWKGRYLIDEAKSAAALDSLGRRQAARAERLLAELEFLERRKSTLYRVLETLIEVQADFLTSGQAGRRRPLTQRAVAARLDVLPSVLNRLISNKSVRLPWGLEAPLKVFVPSGKLIARDRLYELAVSSPGLSDEGLRGELRRVHGFSLSRRSITQYRKELGLETRGLRPGAPIYAVGAAA